MKTKESKTEKLDAKLLLLAKDFAYHCRNLRLNLGWSQRKLAEEMGVTNQLGKITVSRWESGNHIPQKRFLLKFMEIQNWYDSNQKIKRAG